MQTLISFFSSIGDAIVTVFDFIIAFFRDFMQFLQLLVKMPEILANVLSWIPGELFVSLAILFGVVILYKVLGREG